jgi:hypothetical protein
MTTTARDVADHHLNEAMALHSVVCGQRLGFGEPDPFGFRIGMNRSVRDFHLAAALLVIIAYGSKRIRRKARLELAHLG